MSKNQESFHVFSAPLRPFAFRPFLLPSGDTDNETCSLFEIKIHLHHTHILHFLYVTVEA